MSFKLRYPVSSDFEEGDLLRLKLQAATAAAHERLDSTVGELNSLDRYSRYLGGQFAFRRAIEQALDELAAADAPWRIEPLSSHLRLDLDDLKLPRPAAVVPHEALMAALRGGGALGAFYVIEGSALGAILLHRQARLLGLSERYGARHLAAQTADPKRWRSFVATLDESDPSHHDAMLSAASETFELAQRCFSAEQ